MPGNVIAEGEVRVGADIGPAEAGLAKLRADFERSMAAIDRASAEAKITANTTDVDAKIADVKRQLLELDKAKADPSIDINEAEALAEIEALKAALKELNQQKTEISVDSKQLRDANKQRAISSQRQAEMSRQYEKEARSSEKAAQARVKGEQAIERELQKRGQLESRAIRDNERFNRSGLEQSATLAKLREGYAKLTTEEQRLSSKTGRPGGIFRTDTENRALESVRSEMALTEHKIHELGGAVDDIDPSMEKNQNVLGRWANSLGAVRVQMGFFSSTLRQAAVGAVAIGPILTGLIGTATSLIGVIGTGAAGAFSVASAAVSGFGLSAIGLGLVLKPAISEFKEAETVTKAYTKAVNEYGKGSEQAKTAQGKMNKMLSSLDPVAAQAVKSLATIKTRWSDLTKSTRKPIFNAIGQGVKTIQALMPTFARDTVGSVKAIGQAWDGWLKSLRSNEAKQLLNSVMTNFKKAIPGIASGFASIGAAFGRITASASKFLPGLSKGFAGWANEIEQAIGGGTKLDSSIGRLVGHMEDLGHLGQSTGSLLVHLFNTSADSGDSLVKTLTNVTSRWDAWVQSTHGQNSLKTFFSESVDETKELGSVVGGVVRILFQIGRAAAPISQGFLHVLTILGNIVTAASGLKGLDFALKAVGATLAGLWAVNKVRAFVGAIQDAVGAVRTLAASVAGGSAVEGAGGASGGLLARLMGKSGDVEKSGAEAQAAFAGIETSAATAGAEVTGFSALLAPEVLVPVVGVAALAALAITISGTGTAFEEAEGKVKDSSEAMNKATDKVVKSGDKYNSIVHKQVSQAEELRAARQKLVNLQAKGAKPSEEIKQLGEIQKLEHEQVLSQREIGEANTSAVNRAKTSLAVAHENIKAAKEARRAANEKVLASAGETGEVFNDPNHIKDAAAAEQQLAQAENAAALAARALVLANIPRERQEKNLAPLTAKTREGLDQLSKSIGTAATKKIGNFVKSSDVQQITNLSNKLTSLGQGKSVKSIDVSAKGAQQTLNQLKQLQAQTAKIGGLTAKLNVTTNDKAAQQKLTNLAKLSQNVAGAPSTIRILANASNAEQAINRLEAHLRAIAANKYQAELSALDKSTTPAERFHHNLEAAVRGHYSARLEAIDDASPKAKTAKQNAESVGRSHPKVTITANDQASSVIQHIGGEIAALPSSKTINITTAYHTSGSPPGGHAVGGPSDYTTNSALMRAIVRPGGSQKVSRPTMLTGEEGSRHPEYVIATNPAYRDSNARYLKEAADALGYIAVPGYKKGKGDGGGKKKSSSGGGNGGNGSGNNSQPAQPNPGPKPKEWRHKSPWYIKHDTFAPNAVHSINADEKQLEQIEHEYNAELEKEERLISQGQLDKWNFNFFRGRREAGKSVNLDIIHQDTVVEGLANAAKSSAYEVFGPKGERSPNKLKNKEREAKALSNEASKYSETPPGGKKKGESEKTYNDKKNARAKIKHEKEKAARIAEAELTKWKEEAKHSEEIYKQANEELEEVHHQREETRISNGEVQNSINELNYIEANPEAAPYYEEPEKGPTEENISPFELAEQRVEEAEVAGGPVPSEGAKQMILQRRQEALTQAENDMKAAAVTPGNKDDNEAFGEYKTAKEALEGAGSEGGSSTVPSKGEETLTYNQAREKLYQQFASNVTGANAFERASGVAAFNPALAAIPGGNGIAQAVSAAVTATIGNSGGNVGGGESSVNVVNNFAAPPPDPHTWTAQQVFELGVIA